jgi:hypothetical protein
MHGGQQPRRRTDEQAASACEPRIVTITAGTDPGIGDIHRLGPQRGGPPDLDGIGAEPGSPASGKR